MKNFLLIVGLPGSGKSTMAKEIASGGGYIVLSSDAIRKELYGDESVQGDPREIFRLMNERVYEAAAAGEDIIYDATNMRAEHRRLAVQALDEYRQQYETYCLHKNPPIDEVFKRNEQRERKVPKSVIRRMEAQFEPIEYDEGWDMIINVVD